MIRTTRLMLLVVALPVAFGACKKQQTPAVQEPTPVSNPGNTNPTPPRVDAPAAVDSAAIRAEWARAARATLSEILYFEYDSDELTSDARSKLDAKLALLNANPQVRVRIDGHTDERGTDEYNMVLGRRRAEQAKRYLTDRGIDGSRIETMSFGRERPVAQGSNEDAWSQNRRDEFSIISGGENLRPAR